MRSMLMLGAAILALNLHAQKKTDFADVNWGPELNDKTDGDFVNVIGETEDAIFQLMRKKKDLYVQRMDLSMKVAYQKPLELEWDKKDMTLEGIYVAGDRIIVFSSLFDKKEDQNALYMKTYSSDDFKPLKRMEKIARIPAEKSKNKGSFHLTLSPDDSKILVEIERPHEKKGREAYDLSLFDTEMNELWSRKVSLPYDDDEFMRERSLVDNDGSVIMLGVKYTQKGERRERKREKQQTYDYHMIVYSKDSETPQDFPIVRSDKFLQDMTLSIAEEGDILCAGFFGNKSTMAVRGTYFLTLDRRTKEVKHESYKEFADDFITAYMTEREEKKAKKKAERKDEDLEMFEYDMHDIIHRDDGGAVLVAEQYYMYAVTTCTSTPNGGQTCTTRYHYIYNDVIVVNIDPSGDIEWAAKVPKRQHTINDGGLYSGCAVELKGDRIYLIFNDTGENLFIKPGDKVKQFELKGKDALVTIATIDGDGNATREALFTPERRDVILRPQDCVELHNDEMFIYASRKKEYRFGMIKFQ